MGTRRRTLVLVVLMACGLGLQGCHPGVAAIGLGLMVVGAIAAGIVLTVLSCEAAAWFAIVGKRLLNETAQAR